jgi:hypothetical protein
MCTCQYTEALLCINIQRGTMRLAKARQLATQPLFTSVFRGRFTTMSCIGRADWLQGLGGGGVNEGILHLTMTSM